MYLAEKTRRPRLVLLGIVAAAVLFLRQNAVLHAEDSDDETGPRPFCPFSCTVSEENADLSLLPEFSTNTDLYFPSRAARVTRW